MVKNLGKNSWDAHIGINDKDKPEFLPIKQTDVKKALAFRTFWIALHVLTCLLISAGNGRVMGWW